MDEIQLSLPKHVLGKSVECLRCGMTASSPGIVSVLSPRFVEYMCWSCKLEFRIYLDDDVKFLPLDEHGGCAWCGG